MMQAVRSVIGNDERVQVTPMTSPPYKWICYLEIFSSSCSRYNGTGFKIHIPDVTRSVVVTSAHNIFVDGAIAEKIWVNFPGQNTIEVNGSDLYVPPEYIQDKSGDHDYALILLPGQGNSDDGFGWSTIVPNNELDNRLITICGFPGDKPLNTMWITGRQIKRYTANMLYYDNVDRYAGESGSPVYTWYGGYWTVLGVHGYGVDVNPDNSAARLTVEMISRFLQRMNSLNPITLMSVQFPGVYIRCDGHGVTKPEAEGAGIVNCQYEPPLAWEEFYIIPVETRPSSASEHSSTVALESAEFSKVYVRMDSKGMNAPQGPGGGVVNCQASVSTWESFVMVKQSNGGYSFRSVQFPNCFIRMDGRNITEHVGPGAGVVNCQYYPSPSDVSGWESFFMNGQ